MATFKFCLFSSLLLEVINYITEQAVRKDQEVLRAVAFSKIGRSCCGTDLSLWETVAVDN
jgi:hypothetical protein